MRVIDLTRRITGFVVLSTVCGLSLIWSTNSLAQGETPATSTYTQEQFDSGQTEYNENCAACHGISLENGSAPALTTPMFRRSWSQVNTSTADLFYIISSSMPPGGIDRLPDQQYLNIMAYILGNNNVLPGTEELSSDSAYMDRILMFRGENNSVPQYISGERSRPEGSGPSATDLANAAESQQDWLYHTHNYQGTRYSPLSQINVNNVSRLSPSCIYQVGSAGNFQTGPLVHDGVMYITAVNETAAIDAASCRPIWKHNWIAKDREIWLRNRGVALKDGYVVRATTDGYLLALDAKDGTLLWATQAADPWLGETFTMAPLIHEDVIYIGPAGSENAISGWVGAFNLKDGKQLWEFKTVPGATREGGDTWGNPEGIPLGGGGVWTPFSLDVARGELYVAVTNPAPDFPAYLRPGDNLYTNSIVALDIRTGELNWYQQMVPNDDHDWDLTQVSPIVRTNINGVERELVTTVGKDGILRVLDQNNHERLFETEIARIENIEQPVTPEGAYACPGPAGGVEWNGPAWHPGEQLLITPAVNLCATMYASASLPTHVPGRIYMGGTVEMDRDTESGWLTAVDITNGEVRWRYVSEYPMVAAVTTTAGDLVMSGELNGDFIILDAALGNVLYKFNTGGPIGGGIISYAVQGKQYLAVATGNPSGLWTRGHKGAATIVVFALPD